MKCQSTDVELGIVPSLTTNPNPPLRISKLTDGIRKHYILQLIDIYMGGGGAGEVNCYFFGTPLIFHFLKFVWH